jgi:hypothetical protein
MCTGRAEVTGRLALRTHKGKKTVLKSETAVLANAPYSIPTGRDATIELKVTAAGSTVFAHAKAGPLMEKSSVTVRGGAKETKRIRIS